MGSEPRRTLLLALALVVASLLTHRATSNGFLNYDDNDYVTENPLVRDGLSAHGIGRAFTEAHAANWHPVTWVSHMVDVELFGMDARAHQRTSIWLHTLSALLLFLALRALTGAALPSAFVAALFALHPQHVESVYWIAERKDVLAGLFWNATLLAWWHYARSPSRARYALVATAFALGLASKSTVVALPLVLLLLDRWPLGRHVGPDARSTRALVLEKAPLFVLSALASAATYAAQSSYGTTAALATIAFPARVANALRSAVLYVAKAFSPTDLAAFYPHPALVGGTEAVTVATAVAAIALVLAAVVVLRNARRAPWLLTGCAWYALALLPAIGLVQVGEQARADRYAYLPLVGVYVAVVWSVRAATARSRALSRAAALVGFVALALFARATILQARVWSDSTALFEHALAVTENNYVALNQLAHLDLERGDTDAAERRLLASIRMHPDAKAFTNLARVYSARTDWVAAESALRRSLALGPRGPEAHNNLGIVLARTGRPEEAARSFRRSTELRPTYAEAWFNLGALELQRGERGAARAALTRALALDPGDADARALLERASE